MKHMTEAYGQPCNNLSCTNAEYWIMKKAFEPHGVRVRMISCCGDDVLCQIINPYKDFCWDHLTGDKIKKQAENEIANGY